MSVLLLWYYLNCMKIETSWSKIIISHRLCCAGKVKKKPIGRGNKFSVEEQHLHMKTFIKCCALKHMIILRFKVLQNHSKIYPSSMVRKGSFKSLQKAKFYKITDFMLLYINVSNSNLTNPNKSILIIP